MYCKLVYFYKAFLSFSNLFYFVLTNNLLVVNIPFIFLIVFLDGVSDFALLSGQISERIPRTYKRIGTKMVRLSQH